jgi:hypothetical protein
MKFHTYLLGNFRPYRFEKTDLLTALIMFFATTVLYTLTMTPSVSAGDSGELMVAMQFLGIAHAPGYPLHSFMGKLFTFLPIHNVAWRATFFSAFCGGLTIYFTVLVMIKIIMSSGANRAFALAASVLGAFAFAISETMWSQAIMCEVYTMSSVFHPVLLLILLSWFDEIHTHAHDDIPFLGERYLIAYSFIFGVALTGHQTGLLTGVYAFAFIVYTLYVYVFEPRKLSSKAAWGGFLMVCWLAVWLLFTGATYYYFIVRLESSLYLKNNVYYGMGGFFAGNLLILLPYLYFRFIAPEQADPTNYLQKGYFTVVKMMFAAYIGWFILMYMYIRSHGNPPINWMGINEASEIWGKMGKTWNAVYRKQYGRMGKLPTTLHNLSMQLKLLFTGIHGSQYSVPVYLIGFLGLVQLFRRFKLMFATILLMLISYNLLLTLNLGFNFEKRDMSFVGVFFIFSYFTLGITIALGFQFLFETIGSLFGVKNQTPVSSQETT